METPLLKIDSIRRCLRRVRETAARDPELSQLDIQDIVVLNLQRACEQAIDLANWLCAFRNFDVPRTSQEVFSILEREGILEAALAISMRKMIGFRNIAVHEYRELDPAILKSIVRHRLSDFENLIHVVSQNLALPPTSRLEFLSAESKRVLIVSLESVTLSGDDLGDDYELSFFFLPEYVVNYRLDKARDQTAAPRELLATVLVPQGLTSLKIKVVAKELDPIADDVGECDLEIDLNRDHWDDQLITTEITIKGQGRTEQNLAARMLLSLNVAGSTGPALIADIDPNGWVLSKFADNKTVPLPQGLAVEFNGIENSREVFRILEGQYKGVSASIAVATGGGTHLGPPVRRAEACSMTLFLEELSLKIVGLGSFKVLKMPPSETIKAGVYPVCVPDLPHEGGRRFRSKARHAETWFRISDAGDRYLHPGARSKGCVTLEDIGEWERVYHFLINCRLDDLHIGTLEVV